MKKIDYIDTILDRLGLDTLDVSPDAEQKRVRAVDQLPDMLKSLQSGTIFMKTYSYIPFFLDHIEYVAYHGERSDKTYKATRTAILTALSILIDISEVDEPLRETVFAVWKQYFLSCLPQQDKRKAAKR